MQAGRLRTQVTIEQLLCGSPQQLPTGEPDESWATLYTAWAHIQPVLGREYFAAEQVQSKVDTKIRIRYRSGITAAMRVVAGGVNYNIEAVMDIDNRHEEIILMCSTGVNNG